jgi:hypothetical protein
VNTQQKGDKRETQTVSSYAGKGGGAEQSVRQEQTEGDVHTGYSSNDCTTW